MKKFITEDIVVSKIELACHVAVGEGSRVHKNRASHGIVLSLANEKIYTFDNGKKLIVSPNHILYLPKYSNYDICGNKGDSYAINFQIQNEEIFSPCIYKIKSKNFFLNFFKNAESAWRTKPTGFEMKCMAELYQILFNVKKECEDNYISNRNKEIIQPALEYIHNKYNSEIITIPQLSELCNTSQTYFRRIFKDTVGVSPLKYVNSLRIERAKELISSNMYSITEVSFMSGYNDECYFSREFKKAVGVSPSEYK